MADPVQGPIEPGQTIGILGGGQLARMLALAAARLGLKTIVLAPEKDSRPVLGVAWRHLDADYDDKSALKELAAHSAIVTYEFENVPVAAVKYLASRVPVAPGHGPLETTQDRLLEKRFLAGLGIETARFDDVTHAEDLATAGAATGFPAILKTRRGGYDGKGQVKVAAADELAKAWNELGKVPSCLEGFVAFDGEASIVAARGVNGEFAAFDLTENTHRNHILWTSRVPARWNGAMTEKAHDIARRIGAAFDYVGVFAVEFFVVGNKLIVNEIAPRVHNSGHWTLDGAETSQFEQHVRAICGWPLGATRRHSDAEMTNLIGEEVNAWAKLAEEDNAHIHLYGKREARPGRKMAHVTRTWPLGRFPGKPA
jgi:5-(carboxyamino)imidazole ribonucleotide synthase